MDRRVFAQQLIKSLPSDCEVISAPQLEQEEDSDRVIFSRDGRTYYMQPGNFPGTAEFTLALNAYETDNSLWFIMQANYLNYSLGGVKFQVRPVRDEDRLLILLECSFVVFVLHLEELGIIVPAVLDHLQEYSEAYETLLEHMEHVFNALTDKEQERFSDDLLLFDAHQWNQNILEEVLPEDDAEEDEDDLYDDGEYAYDPDEEYDGEEDDDNRYDDFDYDDEDEDDEGDGQAGGGKSNDR